jgi:hypothetical protein
MNLRRAAALAFVSWYLIVPPVHRSYYDNKPFVDRRASIWYWEVRGTFDSVTDCAKAIKQSQTNAQHKREADLERAARVDANLENETTAVFEATRLMTCIPQDDPRLKRK